VCDTSQRGEKVVLFDEKERNDGRERAREKKKKGSCLKN
jgi:hypothetical protein